jgi:hypothetical protein
MSSSNSVRVGYKKEVTYGITPAAAKAALVIQDITWTAVNGGEEGNSLQVEYLDTVSAGSETVTVSGSKVTVNIDSAVSTATQIMTAVAAAAAALATLGIGAVITGTAGNAQNAVAVANLTGGSGAFQTARFTGEKYSGTPKTTESAQIRTDRQSSGQIVTSLAVDGGHNFELAKEGAIDDFLESAMFNTWATNSIVNGTFSLNLSTKKFIRATGSFVNEGVVVGDFLILSNFAVAGNNAVVMATNVTALEVTFSHPTGMVTAAAEAASYKIADKLSIGTTKKSITIEKTFLDLTNKALVYKGCLVSQMQLKVEYGSLISGSFDTQGNTYAAADAASEFASYNEYFADAATTDTLNGSVDMPFIATDVTGSWAQDAFCLQNINISLNNNLSVLNCIGQVAPENYSAGTAQISADLSSYLKDANWDLLARKLSQASFALGFMVKNADGGYGFYIPALQVSFDDPTSGGANQEISMDMKGVAKVGDNGESALTIYRIPA